MAEKEIVTPEQETVEEVKKTEPTEEKTVNETKDIIEDKEPKASKESKKTKASEKTELEKLQDDYTEINDKYLRLMAEYDNFRKRSQREHDAIYPEATAAAVAGFIGVADNFERAIATECADTEYKKGTELTYQSLLDAFSKLNVQIFGEVGDAFDPNCHNAVMHVEDENIDAETVVEVFQKGYKLGDRIIRHAMVKVAN